VYLLTLFSCSSLRSKKMDSGFEVFEHGADVGIRGWGASLEEAFVQGARAMFSLMTEDLQSVNLDTGVEIQAAGYDLESLFVAWLNALLTESDLHGLLLAGFEVRLGQDYTLTGTAQGESFSGQKGKQGVEVKGATFCLAEVSPQDGGWMAQCVVDV
jgi:SHS2 domain-containing protein